MTLAALLLDAGGTLLTEKTSRQAIYAEAARRHGLEVDPDAMARCMAETHRTLPRIIAGNWRYSNPWFEVFIEDVFTRQLGLDPRPLALLKEELFAAFADAKNFRLLPGAKELLSNAASRGLRLGLVSNCSPSLAGLLKGLGVLESFDAVLISSTERVEKPDRAIFERALGRLNVQGHEALHVGNDPVQDVRGASECGMQALLFDPEEKHVALKLQRVRALAEIIPWIERQH